MDKSGFGLLGVIGAALVIVSYFLYPESYYQFFQWLQDGFFQAVENSFGGGEEKETSGRGKQ
jgi:hypothetical protein